MPIHRQAGAATTSQVAQNAVSDVTIAGTPNVALTSHTTQNAVLLTSSSRTVTTNVDLTNEFWRGLYLQLDVTTFGTGSISPSILMQNPITSTYTPIWTAAAAVTGSNGLRLYLTYPGISTTPPLNVVEAFPYALGRSLRISVVANNANPITYSLAAVFLI